MISVADERSALLVKWLETKTPFKGGCLRIASADASFRRYFRLLHRERSYIVMDAPPDMEDSLPFVEIGEWMKASGISVPAIYAKDMDQGFMVLSDFGDFHFQDALKENKDRNNLYKEAIHEIVSMQTSLIDSERKLPVFDISWQWKELNIFREWCLPNITEKEYHEKVSILVKSIDQIPKSFMHRDFHCRNILVRSKNELGIIDFQGAMHGPITYDLVSLLRDCYVDNDENWISQKVLEFQESLKTTGVETSEEGRAEFTRWFDLVGLQRHLKCVGIFHRLKMRDRKPEYMKDIPRVLSYINTVLERNPELHQIKKLVQNATIEKQNL